MSPTAEQLLELGVRLGVAAENLDDLVITNCEIDGARQANQAADPDAQEVALDEAYARASAINNGGLSEQLEYLIEAMGPERVQDALRAAAR